MLRGISIQFKLLGVMALVILVASAVYAVVTLSARKEAVIREADQKLLVAAESARAIVGANYHDRIFGQTSVSKEEFDRTTATYDQICRETGLQYMWSVMVLNGQIVFTSATHSVLTDPNSDCAKFLEVHTDPAVYQHALETMRPDYLTFHNKWGEGRMVLIPGWDSYHRKYIFGASIALADLGVAVHRTIAESLLMISAIALAAILVSYPLARSLSLPIMRLTQASQRMARGELDAKLTTGGSREVRVLSASLDAMRQAIQAQLETLRREIEVRRQAEERVRESERHFESAASYNRRLVQELEHRVRNNLAGLISLVSLMKTSTGDVATFADALEGRLRALVHIQKLLSDSHWGQVSLRLLVSSTLEAVQPLARYPGAIEVDGPEVSLSPDQVTPLTLVLVEWFTNSGKYGAHSVPEGRLAVGWGLQPNGQATYCRLTWKERGGPSITQPVASSLGTQLVHSFVVRELHGRCAMAYPPEGAEHVIEFPCVPQLRPAEGAAAGLQPASLPLA